MLSWYNEPAPVLARCMSALNQVGVDHLIAVDGRYALYPGEEAVSPLEQRCAMVAMAGQMGMGLSMYVPPREWAGGEVEKRTFMFDAGLVVAEPGDWYLVVDADVIVRKVPDDLKERLQESPWPVASASVRDMEAVHARELANGKIDNLWPEFFDIRPFFRAQPIRLDTNHYTYVTMDGRKLWTASQEEAEQEPGLDLRELVELEHHPSLGRDGARKMAKMAYYCARDGAGVERGDCMACERKGLKVDAVKRMPSRWERTKGEQRPHSVIEELCQECGDHADIMNERKMRTWGILCGCNPIGQGETEGKCPECGKPIRPADGFRVIERNGRPFVPDARDVADVVSIGPPPPPAKRLR
jgi:hypothetical protein